MVVKKETLVPYVEDSHTAIRRSSLGESITDWASNVFGENVIGLSIGLFPAVKTVIKSCPFDLRSNTQHFPSEDCEKALESENLGFEISFRCGRENDMIDACIPVSKNNNACR